MGISSYDYKIIQSGDLIEVMSFTEPVFKGYSVSGGGNKASVGLNDTEKESLLLDESRDHRNEYLHRTRRELERLSYCNFNNEYTTLITLTYKDNQQNLEKANRDFSKFIMRLKYVLKKYNYPYRGFELKYICKPEFQKRGAIHYHFVCNLRAFPFAKKNVIEWQKQGTLRLDWDVGYNLQDIWKGNTLGRGSADLEQIDKSKGVVSVISYLTEYMTKQFTDDRFIGQKSYFPSRNLDKPVELFGDKAKDYLQELLKCNAVKKIDSWVFSPKSLPEQNISFLKYLINPV